MTEKSARSVPQTNRQLPRALAVEPGPLNGIKLELGLAIFVLFALLMGVESWIDDVFVQLAVLGIGATIVSAWLIIRTRRVLAKLELAHHSEQETVDEMQSELRNGQK